jgi:signal transduction histidine kinase
MRVQGIVLSFVLSLLLPGAALGYFGIRALIQERQVIEHQLRVGVERATSAAVSEIEAELGRWQKIAIESGQPPFIDSRLANPGDWLVLFQKNGALTWSPQESLLFALSEGDVAPYLPSRELLEVEEADRQNANVSQIISRYEALLENAITDKPRILHHLARAYVRADHEQKGREVLQRLAHSAGTVGAVPAALIGNYELCRLAERDRNALVACARSFYRRLVSGEWLLTRERYSYYASTAGQWLAFAPAGDDEIAHLHRVESAKRALTEAMASASARCGSAHDGTASPIVDLQVIVTVTCHADRIDRAVAVSRSWALTNLFPRLLSGVRGDSYEVAVSTRGGELIFASAPPPSDRRNAEFVVAQRAAFADGIEIRAWPRDPDSYGAALAARQRIYGLTLVLVIGSLVFGAYATARVVRRELAVAQLKSEFVATVSHEFRSPLTAIRQAGEMLARNRVAEAKRAEYYERISAEAERLTRLVENLLDFAQIESGKKEFELAPLPATPWLRSVANEFGNLRESQGTRLETTIPDDLPVVRADAAALSSAIHNLLDNAVKYSPHERCIWLEACVEQSDVVIRVRDHGVGIAPDERSRIFEKFYRGQGEIAREVKGAGLGLSLVQRVVAAHRGRIQCESEPGAGTTFSIHLPACADVS